MQVETAHQRVAQHEMRLVFHALPVDAVRLRSGQAFRTSQGPPHPSWLPRAPSAWSNALCFASAMLGFVEDYIPASRWRAKQINVADDVFKSFIDMRQTAHIRTGGGLHERH